MIGALVGRIVDNETKEPLDGALVSGLYNSVLTDPDGSFQLELEEKDGDNIRLQYPDYFERFIEVPSGSVVMDLDLFEVGDLELIRDPDADFADVEIIANRTKKSKFPWWLVAVGVVAAAANRK